MEIEHIYARDEQFRYLVKWKKCSLLHLQWVGFADVPLAVRKLYQSLPTSYTDGPKTLEAEFILDRKGIKSLPVDDEFYSSPPAIHEFYMPTVDEHVYPREAILVKWKHEQSYAKSTWEWMDECRIIHTPPPPPPPLPTQRYQYPPLLIRGDPETWISSLPYPLLVITPSPAESRTWGEWLKQYFSNVCVYEDPSATGRYVIRTFRLSGENEVVLVTSEETWHKDHPFLTNLRLPYRLYIHPLRNYRRNNSMYHHYVPIAHPVPVDIQPDYSESEDVLTIRVPEVYQPPSRKRVHFAHT